MSKIGNLLIKLPQGVSVEPKSGSVTITGPKGAVTERLPRGISVKVADSEVRIETSGKSKTDRSLHGTIRSLVANAVKGVSEGWGKKLELVGTGFRAELSGKTLTLTVGYSHPVKIEAPEGISFKVEKNIISVDGINREDVGQVSANIRSVRPPEPYKGKGIKYVDEIIRRKAGKAAAKTTGPA